MFNKNLAEFDGITLEQPQQPPAAKRVKELFARLWEYWL